MQVFELNARRYPNAWPVHAGLARGYAALGKKKQALAEARLALPQAPNEDDKKALQETIQRIEDGKATD